MFNVIIETEAGAKIHTFDYVDFETNPDISEFWLNAIRCVQGYSVNETAMYDVPDWKVVMMNQYPEDVEYTAHRAAAMMGITLGK